MLKNVNISNELKELDAAVLLSTDNKNYYAVPDTYFENLAENIHTAIFIQSLPVSNPYHLPEHYFTNLPELVVEKIQLNEILKPSAISDDPVFAVPEGYFEGLAANIINTIKSSPENSVQEELQELSPLLSGIPKTNVYSVPEGYFNELAPSVEKAEQEEAAKVISIGSRARKWISYAAAACIGAAIIGGGYLYFNKKPLQQQSAPNNYAATLPKMDIQKEISALSDDAITNYLNENSSMAVYTNFNESDQTPSMDVQTLLQNVSDEEIQQYLNQSPEEGEAGGGS
jgi:hypothetical protein